MGKRHQRLQQIHFFRIFLDQFRAYTNANFWVRKKFVRKIENSFSKFDEKNSFFKFVSTLSYRLEALFDFLDHFWLDHTGNCWPSGLSLDRFSGRRYLHSDRFHRDFDSYLIDLIYVINKFMLVSSSDPIRGKNMAGRI